MKLKLILLELLLITNVSQTEEIIIYRKKIPNNAYFSTSLPLVTGIVSIGIGIGAYTVTKDPLLPLITMPTGALGIGVSIFKLRFFKRWDKLLDKPKLILDDEGFTYEIMNKLGTTKNVRYLWKDVIEQWDNNLLNWQGIAISSEWCYRIRGQDNIVTIIADELNIPDAIKTQVESMRSIKKINQSLNKTS